MQRYAVGVAGAFQPPWRQGTPANTSTKYYYWKDCSWHLAWLASNTVEKKDKAGETIPCLPCLGKLKHPEMVTWLGLLHIRTHPLMHNTLLFHGDFVVTGSNTHADFGIRCTITSRWLLLIQADGAQHMHRDMHGNTVEQQSDRDKDWDTKVVEQGFRALRVHYLDLHWVTYWVCRALVTARSAPYGGWVMYTTKYNKPTLGPPTL